MNMRKILFVTCLFVAGIVWAVQPENIVRAYNKPEGGFIIWDADNSIIGFANEGYVSQDSNNGYVKLLSSAGKTMQIVDQLPPEVAAPPKPFETQVGPLLGEIEYNQGAPYNLLTPVVGSAHCVTGCVATAMAQIMAYWKFPDECAKGQSIDYYTGTSTIHVKVNYDTVAFDWNNVLPKYGIDATQQQRIAVARLMFACGSSTKMNYTTGSSGTLSTRVPSAFVDIFKYSNGLRFESEGDAQIFSSPTAFAQALMSEFDAGRPIYASGTSLPELTDQDSNHAFVIDGYAIMEGDTKKQAPYFHFNWGWGGASNGFYRITGSSDRALYTSFSIIRGIEPQKEAGLFDVKEQLINNGVIYDMLGRPVNHVVPGTLYIQNGKTFMAN